MKQQTLWLIPAAIAIALTLALAHGSCRAEPGNPLTDRFSLSLGGFLVDTSTDLRVDGATNQGTEFDLERDLGYDETNRFRFDGYWRFAPRHKVRVMYFDTRRESSRAIDEEIVVRDTTYPINTVVNSHFDTTVAELAYEYAFLRRDRYEIAASLGLHNLKFDIGLSADDASQAGQISQSADANGPLPVLGFRGVWRLGKYFYADAQAQFFKISIDPYDGRIEDYNASIVWKPWQHVGFGLGYNEFVTRLDVDADLFEGRMEWRYGGARLFITGSF